MRGPPLPVILLVVVGCTTTTLQPAPPQVAVSANNERTVMEMVRQALRLEPGSGAPDSLFAVGATFVANGRDRVTPPRMAGIGRGGSIRITSLAGEVVVPYAYAVAAYRWDASDGSAAEIGRATFVLQRINGRWQIKHVHSSMVLPWERTSRI